MIQAAYENLLIGTDSNEDFYLLYEETEEFRNELVLRETRKFPEMNEDDIEIIVLESLLETSKRSNLNNFEAYLRKNVGSRVIDQLRKKIRKDQREKNCLFNPDEDGSDLIDTISDNSHPGSYGIEDLESVVERFSPDEREVFQYRAVEGLLLEQIRTKMGYSLNKVRRIIAGLDSKVLLIGENFCDVDGVSGMLYNWQRRRIIGGEDRLKFLSFRFSNDSDVNGSRYNMGRILRKYDPEFAATVPEIHKWNVPESQEICLAAIDNCFSNILGYTQAIESGNRNQIVRVLEEFIDKTPKLSDYMIKNGLSALLSSSYDPDGINGLDTFRSPAAVIRFLDKKRDLHLFDPAEEEYLPRYKISERNMWNRGEESVEIAREGIQYVLRKLDPYFRQAELDREIKTELRIVDDCLIHSKEGRKYFKKELSGVMRYLVDPNGEKGIRRHNSIYEVLRFYNVPRGLDWFDSNADLYISGGNRKHMKVVSK